jgi:hypothetical protein
MGSARNAKLELIHVSWGETFHLLVKCVHAGDLFHLGYKYWLNNLLAGDLVNITYNIQNQTLLSTK